MISASESLKNVLKNNSSITVNSGCTAEYIINDMINNPTIIMKDVSSGSTLTDSQVYETINGYKPFKNTFPYSSIIKSGRPEYAGVKYAVLGDISSSQLEVIPGSFVNIPDYADPKNLKYERTGANLWHRTYYAGTKNEYQYYLTNKGQGARIAIEYGKTAFTNKIVIKFEISHSVPQSGNIKLKINGSYSQISTFTSSNISSSSSSTPGVMTLYYTGSGWSFNPSQLSTSSYVSITGVELTVNAISNKYIGVIDISPRWNIDISDDVVNFQIQKEGSMDQEIVPVGIISANSLSMSIVKYGVTSGTINIISYDKTNTSFTSSKIMLYKNIILNPYFKVYHAGGTLSDSGGTFDKINQGIFYVDSWNITEFGEASIVALDAAKKLQLKRCPNILCQDFSVAAIIRRLMDSIGFTNYKINTASTANENSVNDTRYWWCDSSKTVWQALQELCTDNQMVAVVDENNVLQIYTRKFLYDSTRSASWDFTYSQVGSLLPNIQNLNKQELRNANNVIVRWNSIESSQGSSDGAILEVLPTTWIGALALSEDLLATSGTGSSLKLEPITENIYSNEKVIYSFSGYLLIDSEIIEYDALQYEYKTTPTSTAIQEWITDESDLKKYRSLAYKSSSEYFYPTGRVRIKTRGAFNTDIINHKLSLPSDGWTTDTVRWT
jgi:hypothetical protein